MKIFVLKPNESWCVDRLVDEWYEHNADISTKDPTAADLIWLCADWCFDQLPFELLKQRQVLTTVHHITSPQLIDISRQLRPEENPKVTEKFFGTNEEARFRTRHSCTNEYHVPCKHTEWQLSIVFEKLGLEPKPIHVRPFWVNDKLWTPMRERQVELRQRYRLPDDATALVGSFQRDSEGESDRAKLEKGPDIFVAVMRAFQDVYEETKKLRPHAVLTPWRRRYIEKNLRDLGIDYTKPSGTFVNGQLTFEQVNELYACLDFYLVSSRVEGGPLAIMECAATRTPIISHWVGLARDGLLDERCLLTSDKDFTVGFLNIATDEEVIEANYQLVRPHLISEGAFTFYRRMFESLSGR